MDSVSSNLAWSGAWVASSTRPLVLLSTRVGASGSVEAREKRATASRHTPMRSFMHTSGGWLKEFTFKQNGCQVKKKGESQPFSEDAHLTNCGDWHFDQGL